MFLKLLVPVAAVKALFATRFGVGLAVGVVAGVWAHQEFHFPPLRLHAKDSASPQDISHPVLAIPAVGSRSGAASSAMEAVRAEEARWRHDDSAYPSQPQIASASLPPSPEVLFDKGDVDVR